MIAHDHLLLVKTGIDVPQKYELCSCLASFSLWAWQFCIWTTQHFRSCALYVKVRQGKSWMVTQGCETKVVGGFQQVSWPSWFSKHFRMEWLETLTGACAAIYLISLVLAQKNRSYSGKTIIFYSILYDIIWLYNIIYTSKIGFLWHFFHGGFPHLSWTGSSAAAVINSRAHSVQSFGRGAFLPSRHFVFFFGTKQVKKTWFNHQNHQMGLRGAVAFYFCFLKIEPYFCWVKQLDGHWTIFSLLTSTI